LPVRGRFSEAWVFVVLIAAGAGARLWLRDVPNFAPVAAIALFAGYYFRSAKWAVAVPLAIMLLSDAVIGGYQWSLMATVYAMLALPVAARGVMRKYFRLDDPSLVATGKGLAGLIGSSLAASVAFFLVTNLMCWRIGLGYSPDLAGLTHCYGQALPFFRNTLLGDLFFSVTLFGGYAWVAHVAPHALPRPAVENAAT
jgi:hypothetical protein